MRVELMDFQRRAVNELHEAIADAHKILRPGKPQVISLSAPTGAGKTVIMIDLVEEILCGTSEVTAEPDSIFVWLSDMPELNQQSREKFIQFADKLNGLKFVTITPSFNQATFEPGTVNFLNTQKIGREGLLSSTKDGRDYTLWQIVENTAEKYGDKFYFIIDEAHRGARSTRSTLTIMQKFLKGSPEDGMSPVPLTIGVTATPERFRNLAEGCTSHPFTVEVSPKDVCESGLIKENIILQFPKDGMMLGSDQTLFKAAVKDWLDKCARWEKYCEDEGLTPVKPALIVQVEDAPSNGKGATMTDLEQCLQTLKDVRGKKLAPGEAVHTFDEHVTLDVGGEEIRYMKASEIEQAEDVRIVFFKMNLSTGWDCPRAETMMSFRRATDTTFIAQLLGRMVRTPLAMRVEDDALNAVSLFLPNFERDSAREVVRALKEEMPIEGPRIHVGGEVVRYARVDAYADVLDKVGGIITYSILSKVKAPYRKILMRILQNLKIDDIDRKAKSKALKEIVDYMESRIAEMKSDGSFEKLRHTLTTMGIGKVVVNVGDDVVVDDSTAGTIKTTRFDLDRTFEKSKKFLNENIATEYVQRHYLDMEYDDVKTDVVVFVNDYVSMEKVERICHDRLTDVWSRYQAEVLQLDEAQRNSYYKLIGQSTEPQGKTLQLAKEIEFSITADATEEQRNLYGDLITGLYKAQWDSAWERDVISEALEDGVHCWHRNLDRKPWSLAIPYERNPETLLMYPDFILVWKRPSGYVFELVEPHDPSRADNFYKAKGLARYAKRHPGAFVSIQLVREEKGADGWMHLKRLDLCNLTVRDAVLSCNNDAELENIFRAHSYVKTGN